MKKPLISVCVITYNHRDYIRECLDAILTQKLNVPWQLVVADDCSTDGTREILKEYQQKYPDLIHLILQKKNVGPEANWLDLIAYPKTKYLLYAEGDDYFTDSTKLQRQIDFLETHPDFAMCFHPVKVIYQDGSQPEGLFPTAEQRFHKRVLTIDDLLMSNFIQTNSVLYRWQFVHKDIKDVYPRGIAPGDWYLHLLHAQAGKIGFIDRAMAVYRRHAGGIWWDSDKNLDAIWRKYGVAHLKLYSEMLKFKNSRVDTHASIVHKIQSLYHSLSDIDTRHNEGLVRVAMATVPSTAELFIQNEIKELREANAAMQQLTGELQALQPALADTEKRLREHQIQLQGIRASRIWKLRNHIARLRGRAQI